MTDWSVRRLNAIASLVGATKYLEIGLDQGLTITGVAVATKVGVDTVPPSLEALAAQGIEGHCMTSDEFFVRELGNRRFDLIFIDGSHVFEQVVRDLLNSLACLCDGGVIVLDDTVPSDVFSTLRDGSSDEQRSAHGLPATHSWHGDVFKAVFLMHDFIPSLSYATITGSGNEQTVVWREPEERSHLFDSLEAISRMTYFDLQANWPAMHVRAESEVLEMIRSSRP